MQNNSDMQSFLSELGLNNVLNVEQDLGDGYVKLRISEAERRQALQDIKSVEDIIVELLRNSRDAAAKNIFIGTKKIEDKIRYIYFIDDGFGIPKRLHNLIFEARVTSKLENTVKDIYGFHGRGMALFSIKLNVDDIRVIFSKEGQGTSFFLSTDLRKVPEKRDQSALPQLVKLNGNINLIGGVNNILKTLVEFNLQNPDINIFYGTPSQIIMSMREIAKNSILYNNLPKFDNWDSLFDYLHDDNNKGLKINYFPCLTDNYLILSKIIKEFFNIEISERTIQRIVYEEFKSITPIDINKLIYTNNILRNKTEDEIKSKISINNESENLKDNHNDKKIIIDNPDKLGKNNKNLKLYDEQKLAFRFQDDEIRVIINKLNNILKETGRKYLIEPDENNISFKKNNNNIQINIALKEK